VVEREVAEVPTFSGDARRLQQVVLNLVTNAVKFTPAGGRIRIHVARAGSHAELSVEDNGVGIAADFLPHLFDRFRQGANSTARGYGGRGPGRARARPHLRP